MFVGGVVFHDTTVSLTKVLPLGVSVLCCATDCSKEVSVKLCLSYV